MKKLISPATRLWAVLAFALFLLAPLAMLSSCRSLDAEKQDRIHVELWTIAERTELRKYSPVPSREVLTGEHMLVQRGPAQSSKVEYLLLGSIEGFVYEAGYRYTLEVEVIELAEPPADSFRPDYRLKRIVQKTKVQ